MNRSLNRDVLALGSGLDSPATFRGQWRIYHSGSAAFHTLSSERPPWLKRSFTKHTFIAGGTSQ